MKDNPFGYSKIKTDLKNLFSFLRYSHFKLHIDFGDFVTLWWRHHVTVATTKFFSYVFGLLFTCDTYMSSLKFSWCFYQKFYRGDQMVPPPQIWGALKSPVLIGLNHYNKVRTLETSQQNNMIISYKLIWKIYKHFHLHSKHIFTLCFSGPYKQTNSLNIHTKSTKTNFLWNPAVP